MKVSFVIPCYCSKDTIGGVTEEIKNKMAEMPGYDYEIVLVNDASPDATFHEIKGLAAADEHIRGIDLARNFGQHAALLAGIRQTDGDIVICLDDDGQTPADEADKLIKKIEEGYDAVYARYESKQHSGFRNFGSSMNAAMTEWAIDKPKGLCVSSYFAVRRFVADEMARYENAYPYVIGLVLRSTKKICNVDVTHRRRRSGASGYSLKKLISLWMNGLTAFSVKPLRVVTYGGTVVALLGLLCAIYQVINKIVNPAESLGWGSVVSLLMILGGAILLALGMIGEYVGRIYVCLNNAPQYIIRETTDDKAETELKRNKT